MSDEQQDTRFSSIDYSDGIIELPLDAIIGDSLVNYYGLCDPVIHIKITPNRGDCLGVYGIARDLAAAGMGTLKALEVPQLFGSSIDHSVSDYEACPLFTCVSISGLSNATSSPDWLKNFLENIGVGSISPVVDVTNYITYTFGQPMHAYDAGRITGGLIAHKLQKYHKFAALNGKEYDLQPGDLVIEDTSGNVHCLAGIIGGSNSACSLATQNIILEAACFDSKLVAATGRRLQIESDSRYRFERGVDQDFTLTALSIAASMIQSICGGEVSQPAITGTKAAQVHKVEFEVSFFEKLIGFRLEREAINKILTDLGFAVSVSGDVLSCIVPSWRKDIRISEDIAEEVVRIYGYDKIPEISLPLVAGFQKRSIARDGRRIKDCKRILASAGYTETVTWSFMESSIARLFSEEKDELHLINSISSDLNYMRPSILPNLLLAARDNLNRSIKNFSLFEVGPIFDKVGRVTDLLSVCGIRCGAPAQNIHMQDRVFDIYDIKSDLADILDHEGLSIDKCQISAPSLAYYHPARSANLMLGKVVVAHFGQVHPGILSHFDIKHNIFAFELNLWNLPFSKEKFGKKPELTMSNYQSNMRDFAFIVDEKQQVGEILTYVASLDRKLIKKVELFDIYLAIEEGKKSVAISVQIQDINKTLAEEDLTKISKLIIDGVTQRFAATLRG